jgi:hypothetical protein
MPSSPPTGAVRHELTSPRRLVSRSRAGGVVVLLVVVALGLSLTACDPTFHLNGGHPPCAQALHYRVNPSGFSAAEMADITKAASMIGAVANVSFQYDGQTSESWGSLTPPAGANWILIEHRTPVIDGRAVSAAASLRPDGEGIYRGGSMWFNPAVDRIPTGRNLDGTWGSTYLKLALHEWMHFVGLGDLDGTHPESMMGGATAPDL